MPSADSVSVVMDASTTISFLMHDEQAPAAVAVLDEIENGLVPHVPDHWRHEVNNALCSAEHSRRMAPAQAESRIALAANLTTQKDPTDADAIAKALVLARRHKIHLYDALYLELALRKTAALATIDKRLAAAAHSENVQVI
ncbi:MAG: type II toxin-antitoxin system VapC family toxin [Puniceicoccales bacterium]|jgi:predicted nucleic acid-binding protein|nr:type II toxin-antitoxin system VapC family toxin [Puniceicoccales bacterium]